MRGFRKSRRPGNREMTTAQRARIDAIKSKGCLACLQLGFEHDENAPQPDAHHLLSGGIRIGHEATVALCKWHHSARLTVEGWDHLAHLFNLGATLLQHPAQFREQFGDDDALLAMQEAVLAGECAA